MLESTPTVMYMSMLRVAERAGSTMTSIEGDEGDTDA